MAAVLMDEAQRAAFLMSQAVCAIATIAGMQASDRISVKAGRPCYTQDDYLAVINNHQLGHNDALVYLMGDR
jgi:hypothetical protein